MDVVFNVNEVTFTIAPWFVSRTLLSAINPHTNDSLPLVYIDSNINDSKCHEAFFRCEAVKWYHKNVRQLREMNDEVFEEHLDLLTFNHCKNNDIPEEFEHKARQVVLKKLFIRR